MLRFSALGLSLILLLAGCAAPEFRPYVGPSVRTGSGGTIQRVKGMEVWNGTPPRKFQILGEIEEEGGGRATERTVLDDLVPVAKAHGADALIILSSGRGIRGVDLDTGAFIGRPRVRVAAVKYL